MSDKKKDQGAAEAVSDVETGMAARCVYCQELTQGNYSIHRDGFGIGPEVWLCDACGNKPTPTCEQIWSKISRQP